MRVLVLHPSLKSPGGSSCLTAWALQALRGDFEVTLLSWTGVEVGHLKATYGTDLRTGDFTLVLPPAWLCRTFALSPIRLGLLRSGLLQKHARALDARERFDLIVSTDDVIDVHRHAVQYVHYPWIFYPRPGDSYEWYHLAPVMRLYRAGIDRFCELSTARMAANTTLTNSAWTALRIAEWYGTKAQVIHPPVAVERAGLPWEKRIDTFTTIGRIAPVKQIVETIDIIETVRARGHEVSLLICGQRDDGRYERRLREMAAARPWIELLVDAPRRCLPLRPPRHASRAFRHRRGGDGASRPRVLRASRRRHGRDSRRRSSAVVRVTGAGRREDLRRGRRTGEFGGNPHEARQAI
jgi:glycosyltransferase involved in cell wall biosynthesis